ncbi:hypothetical protein EKPJFOCH_3853 [Methylobacterium thuringiense]|uniref:Uncharacterized protein n=1 Tax=Methylobacterium thuringiense TaxID=1003091 RepID=A0ABQ4TR38_9HYPH|nr:hypothetical protein EKPJFOCH_3853 [Methylobacterium thuringiense]
MPLFRLRGAVRQDDSEIGMPKIDETFEAANSQEAMLFARNRAFGEHEAVVNAIWLTDTENNTL